MSREEKINDLVDRLAEWDSKDLLEYVQERYRHELNIMDEEMLEQEWEDCFGDILGNSFKEF